MMKSTSAQSLRNKISGLDTFTAWGPPRSIGPHSLSCLRINPSVTVQAARLDTGPVASRYPGGIFPRLSCRHCQVRFLHPLVGRSRGTLPNHPSTLHIHLCPGSTGSQYMSGHPPTMHTMCAFLQACTAAADTLPWNERWSHTRGTPRSAACCTILADTDGCVTTTTPSSSAGMLATFG